MKIWKRLTTTGKINLCTIMAIIFYCASIGLSSFVSDAPLILLKAVITLAGIIVIISVILMMIDATISYKNFNKMYKEWKDRYNAIKGRIICPADPYGEENWND